jgi:uncharacterized protein
MLVRLCMRRVATRYALAAALAAIIGFGVAGLARSASAQGAAPSVTPSKLHEPSPAEILLAKKILDLKHVQNIFEPLVRGVIIKTRDSFLQTNFMWSKDLNDVAADLEKQYASRVNELVDEAARIYASHFSEQELKQILALYQSPLGEKIIDEEPKAIEESMAAAGAWADLFSHDVIESMRAEMKKRGHDM